MCKWDVLLLHPPTTTTIRAIAPLYINTLYKPSTRELKITNSCVVTPNPGPASNVKMGCVSSGALQCPAMPCCAATIIYVGCCNPICSLPPPLKSIVTTHQWRGAAAQCTDQNMEQCAVDIGSDGRQVWKKCSIWLRPGGPRLHLNRISLWWWYCRAASRGVLDWVFTSCLLPVAPPNATVQKYQCNKTTNMETNIVLV